MNLKTAKEKAIEMSMQIFHEFLEEEVSSLPYSIQEVWKIGREAIYLTQSEGWIGVDLDGTLVRYDGWKGADHIGDPIPEMMARVHQWLAEGRKVKIFTARCAVPEQLKPVKKWLADHGLGDLEITNIKDHLMMELWDDRCVRVGINTGQPETYQQ